MEPLTFHHQDRQVAKKGFILASTKQKAFISKDILKLKFLTCSSFLIMAAFLSFYPMPVSAQEEDARFLAVDIKGKAMVYRDQMDETTRFRTGQTCDDGDKIATGPKSDVVLRLKNRAYIYISSNTKVIVSKLRTGDKGLQVRLNLIKGRILCQLDKALKPPFEITAGKLLARAHSILFEASRKKDNLQIVCFEGVIVASSGGHVDMVKSQQLVKFETGRFRYRVASLRADQETHLQEWKDRLKDIQEKKPTARH